MKKILVVIIIFLIVLSGVETKRNFTLLEYFSGEYIVYTSKDNSENSVDLGFCYMNSKPVTNNVIGESISIENLEVGSAITTLKARVIKTETLEDGTCVIYAYSSLIDENITVDGKKVNLQIATKGNRSVIGWPLILGSY